MIKSYIINTTNSYHFCRDNPTGSKNNGDIAEVSVAEFFGDYNHDMNRRHDRASIEPDVLANGIAYQVKAHRCGITLDNSDLHTTLATYKCDLFIVACVCVGGYKCYELDKAQFEQFVENCFCKKGTESRKNKPNTIGQSRLRYRLEKTDKAIINYLDRL